MEKANVSLHQYTHNTNSTNSTAHTASNINHDVSKAPTQVHLSPGYPTTFEKFTSYRFRLCYMLVLALSLIGSQQNSMAFALVCMTGGGGGGGKSNLSQHIEVENVSIHENISHYVNSNVEIAESVKSNEFEFSWDSATQGFILSSTFYGAMVSPFIGSGLSRRFGPKVVIVTAMLIAGLASLLTPILARTNVYLVIVERVVMGFFLNMILAASQDLWVHWAPVQDKAQLLALTFTGNQIANIVTFTASGFLCTIPVDNGWPFIFYVFGSLAICWCLLWCLSVYNTPESHPAISEMEKHYISLNRRGVNTTDKKPQIPWKSLLTCPPFWAYVFSFFCYFWTASLLFNFLPTYMSTVLDFEITANGILSSVPYVTRFVGMVSWTVVSEFLTQNVKITTARKTMQAIGSIGASVLTLGIIYVPVNLKTVAVVLFALLTALQCAGASGATVTTLDFAPQFASVTTAFGTVAAVLSQMLSSQITSLIIVDRTKEQWNIAFFLSAGINMLALIVFLIFGSGELQPWADNSIPVPHPEPGDLGAHDNKSYEPDDESDGVPEETGRDTTPQQTYSTYL